MTQDRFYQFIKLAADNGVPPEQAAQFAQQDPQAADEMLQQALSSDPAMQGGQPPMDPAMQGGQPSEEELAQIAQAIQTHQEQNPGPENGGDLPQDIPATEGLQAVKQAEYIYGFLKRATEYGYPIDQAVDMYGDAVAQTAGVVKQACINDANLDEYCEGFMKRAAAHNLPYEQAVALLQNRLAQG